MVVALNHNVFRAIADAHKAAGAFLFAQPEHAEFILPDNVRVAYGGAFPALVAHFNVKRPVRIFAHPEAREVFILNFVIRLGAGLHAFAAACAQAVGCY